MNSESNFAESHWSKCDIMNDTHVGKHRGFGKF